LNFINITDEVEEVSVEKSTKNEVVINLKFNDNMYKIHLNLDNNNRVIDLGTDRDDWYPHWLNVSNERKRIIYTIEVMIRKFLILNKAYKFRYRTSDTGPR